MGVSISDGIGRSGLTGGTTVLDVTQSRHDFGRSQVTAGRGLFQRSVDSSPPSVFRGLLDRLKGVRDQLTSPAPTTELRTVALQGVGTNTALGRLTQSIANHTSGALQSECNGALDDVVDAQRLLGEEPQGHGRMVEYGTALRSMATLLRGSMERLNHMGTAAGGEAKATAESVMGLLEAQAKQLESRAEYLETNATEHPATRATIGRAKAMEVNAAIRLIDERIAGLRDQLGDDSSSTALLTDDRIHDQIDQLTQLRTQLVARRDEFLNGDAWKDTTPLSKSEVKSLMGESLSGSKARALASFFGTNQAVVRDHVRGLAGNGLLPPDSSQHLNERGILAEYLSARFAAIGVESKVGDVAKSLQGHYLHALNDQPWTTVDRTVNVTHDGRIVSFQSTQTPAGELGGVFEAYNGRGVCCHDSTEPNHTVNLWRSELRDGDGNVLFKGYRHGVHCAYGIDDPVQRATANRNRAMETVTAMITGDPDKLAQAENSSQDAPLTIDVVSLSLLTPDAFRSLGSGPDHISHDAERLMMRDQKDAWDSLTNAGAMQVTLKRQDGTPFQAWVKVDAMMFNFGVNQGAVGSVSGILGGWGTANEEVNNASMAKLLGSDDTLRQGRIGGKVGALVADLDRQITDLTGQRDALAKARDDAPEQQRSEMDRQIADLQSQARALQRRREETVALARQVGAMWLDGSYRSEGSEPYKMVSRLAVLVNRTGTELCWNCKSGKDRTSELDVEAKELVATMALENRVPPIDQQRTPESQRRLLAFVESSGSREIQTLNTGGPGSKLKGVNALFSQIGVLKNDLRFLGLSNHFKS